MVKFIESLVIKFNKLIIDYFVKNYNLESIKKFEYINKRSIFIYKNSFVINNKILNLQYNTNLNENKYSLVYILYRNISCNEIDRNNNQLKCYLDFETKSKIQKDYEVIKKNFLEKNVFSKDVIIIGRKYIHKNKTDKNVNSLGLFCKYTIQSDDYLNNSVKKIRKTKGVKINKLLNEKKMFYNSNIRREFLFNLKSSLSFESTLYINNIMKSGLFLDVEYINDIYDDFETFPMSKDYTLLFMIGYTFIDKNKKLEYKNFIVNKLDKLNEYELLNNFLNDIIEKYNKTQTPIIIFHWSHADKSIIEKSLKRHPDLYNKYINEVTIKYIDLLLIFKKTIFFESYSLKFIAKQILNITYDTKCQNGFDAMCSIIQNNCILEKYNKYNKLDDFISTNDIIKYNRMDTELLYVLLKKIIS